MPGGIYIDEWRTFDAFSLNFVSALHGDNLHPISKILSLGALIRIERK